MVRMRSIALIAPAQMRGRSPVADRCHRLCTWLLLLALTCQTAVPCGCAQCDFCGQNVTGVPTDEMRPASPQGCHSHRASKAHTACCHLIESPNGSHKPSHPAPVDSPCRKLAAYVVTANANARTSLNLIGDTWVCPIIARLSDRATLRGLDRIADRSSPPPLQSSLRGVRLQV